MANLYWVGGTWTYDWVANRFATTSGGVATVALPTSSDTVTFDTLSNATGYTATISATLNCSDLTIWAPLTWALTFAWASAINVFWNFSIAGTNVTRTYTGNIGFFATTTGKTLTFNWVTMASSITFNGVGWGWTLQDNLTTSEITVTNGSFNTNTKTVTLTWAFSASNSNTRTVNITSSTINCAAWSFTTTTGLTFTYASSTIVCSWSFAGWWLTYETAVINWAASTFSWANTFTTLTRTGTATKTNTFTLSADQIVTGTLTLNGNSVTNRLLVLSNTIWTARTITAWTASVSNADFKDIVWAWAGSWNLSAITWLSGDCWGNSWITFTTPATQYAKTWASANWSWAIWFTTSWGAVAWRVPLPQDTAVFDANSITAWSVTITQDMPRIPTVNWTGVTNTPTWTTSTTASVFGSITLVSWMTLTASTQQYTFEWRGSYTITNATKTWNKTMSFSCPTWTYTLQDALDVWTGNNITTTAGTLDTNWQTVTCANFQSTGTITRSVILWASLMLCWWNFTATTGLTFNAGTSTIKITSASVNFAWWWLTYNNFWFARWWSAGNVTISGSNTFNDFKDDWTIAHSILFTAGTTQTVNTFTVNGTAWQLITLNSTTTAAHNLVKSGWGTISCDYLNIQHSVATPANTWYAWTNSVDNQAVATAWSWWIFTAPPVLTNTSAWFFQFL